MIKAKMIENDIQCPRVFVQRQCKSKLEIEATKMKKVLRPFANQSDAEMNFRRKIVQCKDWEKYIVMQSNLPKFKHAPIAGLHRDQVHKS